MIQIRILQMEIVLTDHSPTPAAPIEVQGEEVPESRPGIAKARVGNVIPLRRQLANQLDRLERWVAS